MKKVEHYYSEEPESFLKAREIDVFFDGFFYKFKTPSGVFSYGKPDKASMELIKYSLISENEKVLDLGCGYGLIGVLIKKINPGIKLYMSDINKRALKFAKENSLKNNIVSEIKSGNLFDPWKGYKFDNILCNPPFAAGKKIWAEIVEESPKYLSGNGKIHFVAYHNKGGETLSKLMKETFGNLVTLSKNGGIRVYLSYNE
jgi:16S rRNA G1207 methylase RsmC